jgi:hypothetical protein
MKIRKFRAGDMVESASDSEEDKAKTAGLAASNAEKKSSGFLGLGRLFQGNIDEKGSEAYNKYGAGYGREVEAKNDQLKAATLKNAADDERRISNEARDAENARSEARIKAADKKIADIKERAAAAPASKSDTSYADLEKKRFASPRSTVSPGVTRVTEDMPRTKPAGGAQVATGDARVAEYANAFPSNRDEGVRAAKRGPGATTGSGTAAAKTPAAAKPPESKSDNSYADLEKKRFASPRSGSASGSGGGRGPTYAQVDAEKQRGFAANPMSKDPAQRAAAKAPAPAPAAKAPEAATPAKKQLSQAQQRAQAAVARATGNSSGVASGRVTAAEAGRNIANVAGKAGDAASGVGNFFSGLETSAGRRSRLAKEAKDKEKASFNRERGDRAGGGAIRGYASGGSVSASSRGDGIAQRGKTRGKMC